MSQKRRARCRLIAGFLAFLGLLVGMPLGAPAALAVGSYTNADIADDALDHINEDYGADCWPFVRDMIYQASGHTQDITAAAGGGDYFLHLQNAGGTQITSYDSLSKGDVVQEGRYGGHTYIIVSRVSGSTFNVVDSNHNYDNVVHEYQRDVPLDSNDKAFRFGTVTSGSSTGGNPSVDQSRFMTGDVNGDGYADVVVFYARAAGGINVWLLPGTASGLGTPVFEQLLDGWDPAHTKLAGVGDVNSDGYADVIAFYGKASGGINVWRLPGRVSGLGAPVFDQFLSDWSWDRTKLAGLGDVNGDGYSDVVAFYARAAGGINVWRLPGGSGGVGSPAPQQTLDTWDPARTKPAGLGDINGDGYADVVAFYGKYSGGINVWRLPGKSVGVGAPSFDQFLSDWSWDQTKPFGLGDVNNDGYEDAPALYGKASGGVSVWRLPGGFNLEAPAVQQVLDDWDRTRVM